jgi:hypothetical protein
MESKMSKKKRNKEMRGTRTLGFGAQTNIIWETGIQNYKYKIR